MSIKYHVNPHTGQPNICHAKVNPCPFEHYGTWEEAQVASQKYLESNHSLLPTDFGENELDYTVAPYKYDYLYEWHKYDLFKLLRETDDQELMMSVIYRKAKIADDWMMVFNTTKNPNLPRAFVDDVAKYPMEYSSGMQQLMARSPAMTEEHLLLMRQRSKDKDTRYYILSNKNLRTETILKMIDHDPQKLKELEYSGFMDNPNLPDEIKAQVKGSIRRPSKFF